MKQDENVKMMSVNQKFEKRSVVLLLFAYSFSLIGITLVFYTLTLACYAAGRAIGFETRRSHRG